MSTYVDIELKLAELIAENMTKYSADVIKAGALDLAYKIAMTEHANDPRFCVINHAGGRADLSSQAFGSAMVWYHDIIVDFFVPVRESTDDYPALQRVEDDMRQDYDEFLSTVGRNPHCFGANRKMEVVKAFPPDVMEASSRSFIRLRFQCRTREVFG